MARPKELVIEQTLRRVVRDAVANDEEISIRQARARVEKELGLEDGFFLRTNEWKQRSKSVLVAAIAEEPEGNELAPLPTSQPNASKPQSTGATSRSTAKPAKSETNVTKSKAADWKGAESKLSDERVEHDSSDEATSRSKADLSKTETSKKPEQPKQVNGMKRKAEEESTSSEDSESESGSSSEKDDTNPPQKKKARTDPSSGSGDDSEESSDEESEEDDRESEDGSKPPENVAANTTQAVSAIPPKVFIPPSGFTSVESDQFTARLPFSRSNLDGKQIWQITAPSNLSLSLIKELSLESLRSGQPVLTQNGVEYVLSENSDADGDACTVLLPTQNAYQQIDHRVERTIHLQQKIALPNLTTRQANQNTGSSAAAEVKASPITSSKPQPKGLRMRYKPPGSGTGRPGIAASDSDSEAAEQTGLNASATTRLTQDIDAMDVDDNAAERSSKKSKKKHTSKDSGESTKPIVNGVQSHDSGSSKLSKASRPSLAKGAEETLTTEERKRLKRERKEAKQKAK